MNLQREIRNAVNDCQSVIHRSEKWKYVNLNPTAPTLKGLVNIHKEDTSIRPIKNCKISPGYKLAKMLAEKLTSHTPLPFTYNVTNTVQLMNDLTGIPYGHNIKLASLDISSMYSNILTKDLMTILRDLYEKNNIDEKTTQDITRIAQTLIGQNYFRFRDTIYIQNEGLAMGDPTSSILSEVSLQYLENTTIY
jgi:hypothetical protein